MALPTEQASEVSIEGGKRPSLRASLRELWSVRSIVFAFAERDIRLKYKQTVLGAAWAVLQPLSLLAIFAIALGRFANISGAGAPYAAFALSALVPWTYLQTAVTFGSGGVLINAGLIRKVYFPRELPVLGAVIGATLDLAIGMILFFALGPLIGVTPSRTWLLAPLLAFPLVLLGAGAALGLAALNVYYRDFRYAIPLGLQLWLFASPVAYPLSLVSRGWYWPYVVLNPLAGLLDSFRRVLTLGSLPSAPALGVSVASCLFIACAGYWFFKALEPTFADVV